MESHACDRSVRRGPLWLTLAMLAAVAAPVAAETPRAGGVTLLVPGIKLALGKSASPWGSATLDNEGHRQWTGMIGHLRQAGHRFGGVLRPGQPLDTSLVDGEPRSATLFSLEFSASADRDGLAYKTLELASAISDVKQRTGVSRVRLLAYSAGGLVARAYVQSALPELRYRGDVERLVTIATPHLGSELATHLGDLLGTRATAIARDAELIRKLNDELQLPVDVLFASIVVRGVGIRMAGLDLASRSYEASIDSSRLDSLPIEYRQGGDQVVDVRSQNLALTRTAAGYERLSGRPVLYLLARVADPTPLDRSPRDATVHDVATSDPWVALWAELLVADQSRAWSELREPHRSRWQALQAQLSAYGLLEEAAARRHPLWEVSRVEVLQTALVEQTDESLTVRFTGRADSTRKFFPGEPRVTYLSGQMRLDFDRFGRVTKLRCSPPRVVQFGEASGG